MPELLLAWLIATNLLAFILYGLDKRRARKGSRRIPEARLLLVAALGGAPAAWLACSLFRHKTRKRSFQVKLVLATALCAAALYFAWRL